MNQFKRAQIIMLQSNSSKFWLSDIRNKIETFQEEMNQTKELKSFNPQHLYVVSDDEIKKGDWRLDIFMDNPKPIQSDKDYRSEFTRKIIATTDSSLFNLVDCPVRGSNSNIKYILPQPSRQFIEKYIEEYNKGNLIKDVLVEYESYQDSINYHKDIFSNFERLKVNLKDNTITIKKLKDNYSTIEVQNIVKKVIYDKSENDKTTNIFNLEKWIEENI